MGLLSIKKEVLQIFKLCKISDSPERFDFCLSKLNHKCPQTNQLIKIEKNIQSRRICFSDIKQNIYSTEMYKDLSSFSEFNASSGEKSSKILLPSLFY